MSAAVPFDRRIFNLFERPASDDLNYLQGYAQQTLLESIRANLVQRNADPTLGANSFTAQKGFFGDAFFVSQVSSDSISLCPGIGLLANTPASSIGSPAISGLDDLAYYCPVTLSTSQSISGIAAAGAGNERYDIIEVTIDRRLTNSASRDIFNVGTEVFNESIVFKGFTYDLLGETAVVSSPSESTSGIGYKKGVEALIGAASVPATSSGYTLVAIVRVTSSGITAQNQIIDCRKILASNGIHRLSFAALHTKGAPDTIAIDGVPACAPGFRVAARLVSGVSPQDIKFLVIGGDLIGSSAFVTGSMGFSVAATPVPISFTRPSVGMVDIAEQAFVPWASIGQSYISFLGRPGAAAPVSFYWDLSLAIRQG